MEHKAAFAADASSRPPQIDPSTISPPKISAQEGAVEGGIVVSFPTLRPSSSLLSPGLQPPLVQAAGTPEKRAGEEEESRTSPGVPSPLPAHRGPEEGKQGEGDAPPAPALPPLAQPGDGNVAAAWDTADEAGAKSVVGEVYTPAPATNPVLTALQRKGLHHRSFAPGVHEITCPWSHQHGDADVPLATYSEPSDEHRHGSFRCQYPHVGRVGIHQLLDALGVELDQACGKAVIRVLAGEMNRIADAAEKVLVSSGGFYQSGNQIVRIRRDVTTGDIRTEPLADGSLAKALSAGALWLKWDGRSQAFVRTDPPPRHVTMLLRGGEYKHLPILKGLARQPYLRADGEVVMRSGYDSEGQTFGAFSPSEFPIAEPSEAAAREALAALKHLVSEFHLRSEHDRSASIAAMLTAAMRSQLPLAPAFNISASTSGSGKSYLAGLIALFAGPGQPMNISYPVRAEEAGKAVLTMLMTQPAVVLFDDMQTNWIPHGIINRMLTSETVSDRKLGGNEAATVSTSTLVMGTGNNVEPEKDMRRRVVSIYLAPLANSPATLSYEGRPLDAVRQERGRYVAHALTIVRAWIAAGGPKTEVPDIASFGNWSDLCRQPLLWLGEPDPAASLVAQVEADPDADLLATLLRAWHMEFGMNSAMVRTVIGRAETDTDGDLWQAMLDMPFMGVKGVDRNRFGHYLKKNVNRVAGGLQVVKAERSERNAWAVVPAGFEPSGFEANVRPVGISPYAKSKSTVLPKVDPSDTF